MAADASVYQAFMQPPKSILDYADQLDRRELNQLQLLGQRRANELAGFTLEQQKAQARQGLARQNALQALASDPRMANPLAREQFMLNHPLLSAEGQALRKSRLEAKKLGAEGNEIEQKTADKAMARYRELMDRARSPQEAAQIIQAQFSDPVLRPFLPQVPIEQALQGIPSDPQQFATWRQQESQGMMKAQEAMAPKPVEVKLGDRVAFFDMNPQSPTFRREIQGAAVGQSPDSKASVAATMRGQNMTDSRAREANAISREAQQTQIVNDPERGVLLVNKGTKQVTPAMAGGQAMPSENAAKKQAAAKRTLPILDEAEKLIDAATGSYVGAGVDLAARAVGQSTGGADAVAKLKVLEGQLMMAQPRMEGPQSNADVLLYKQMAGQIGDPTVPRDMKRAALAQIRALQEQYAGVPASQTAGTAPPSGFRIIGSKP